MLTLDEAIKHCKEVAESKRRTIKEVYENLEEDRPLFEEQENDCLECAKEHEQLVEWLTELKERREAMEYIKKYYVLVEKSSRDNPNELLISRLLGESEDK